MDLNEVRAHLQNTEIELIRMPLAEIQSKAKIQSIPATRLDVKPESGAGSAEGVVSGSSNGLHGR